MNTRELLTKYEELLQAKKLSEAREFLKTNSDNMRFVALAELGDSLMAGFDAYMEEEGSSIPRQQAVGELLTHVGEFLMRTS